MARLLYSGSPCGSSNQKIRRKVYNKSSYEQVNMENVPGDLFKQSSEYTKLSTKSDGSSFVMREVKPTQRRKSQDVDFTLHINISGSEYALKKCLLDRFPDSLLYNLATERICQQNSSVVSFAPADRKNSQEDKTNGKVTANDMRRASLRPTFVMGDAPTDSYSLPISPLSVESSSRRQSNLHWNDPKAAQQALFFQRSPIMFELVILQSYVTGKVHVPKWMCAESTLEELHFWRLDITSACACCAEETHSSSEDETMQLTVEDDTITKGSITDYPTHLLTEQLTERRMTLRRASSKSAPLSEWEKLKRPVWLFINEPSTNMGSLIFAILSVGFVLVSIGISTLESFRDLTSCPYDTACFGNSVNTFSPKLNITPLGLMHMSFNFTLSSGTDNETEELVTMLGHKDDDDSFGCGYFSLCKPKRLLQYGEIIVIVWFTSELLLRLLTCPSLVKFVQSPLNAIDICSTIPFYVELVIIFISEMASSHERPAHLAILLLQVRF